MKRFPLSGLLLAGVLLSACGVGDDVRDTRPGEAPASEAPASVATTSAAVVRAAPVTGHPRLWIRQADVPRLQSWATASNPMYVNGLQPAVAAAINTYNTQFYPNGQPNPTWPDPGGTNWVGVTTEAYAEMFAFMSLVDPDPTARAAHGQRARNLLMYVMNDAVKGLDTSQTPAPFQGSGFSTYNRANYWGEAFGLTVDWAYPYFSAADKATIQKVFLRWSNECLNASTTSEEHPQPVGVQNSPQLLSDLKQLRWAANNYYTGHMRDLTLMSLALDPADDPPVNPAAPVTQIGNSMQSYLADVTGAWLYQQYAVYTDAATAAATLGVPATGLGVASGGLSVEGFLYGESLGNLQEALLALHTAGYDDPTLSGPQSALIQSPYWDRFVDGFLQSITPTAQTPTDPNYTYMGPLYQMGSYGGHPRLLGRARVHDAVRGAGRARPDHGQHGAPPRPALDRSERHPGRRRPPLQPRGQRVGQLLREPVDPLLPALRPDRRGPLRSAARAGAHLHRSGPATASSPAPTGRRTPPCSTTCATGRCSTTRWGAPTSSSSTARASG